MSTLAVVEKILRETGIPMTVRQIVEHGAGRLPTRSKTPDTVVARDLSMDIKKRGAESRFARTAPGRYTLRELAQGHGDVAADETRAGGNGASKTTEPCPDGRDGRDSAPSVLSSVMRSERAGALPAKTSTTSAERERLARAE